MSVYARRSSELKVAYTYPTHRPRVRSTLRSDPESHEGSPHSISESVEVQIWDARWSATSGDTQRCSGAARTGSEIVLMKVDTTAMKAGSTSDRSHPSKPAQSRRQTHSVARDETALPRQRSCVRCMFARQLAQLQQARCSTSGSARVKWQARPSSTATAAAHSNSLRAVSRTSCSM